MLSDNEVGKLRYELETSKRPFFIFDDDPDGLCSFLLLYRFLREGKGMVLKARPLVQAGVLRKVKEYGADKVFILDIADVEQEFLDNAGVPVVWLDHHMPQKRDKVMYFNPRKSGKESCTTCCAYQVVQQDLWLAAAGCVSDWMISSILRDFKKEYPDYLDKPYKEPPDILYGTRLGELVRVISFNLKGTAREAMKSVRILTRIRHPDEIMSQSTAQGRFLWKKYEKVNQEYQKLKGNALKKGKVNGNLFVFSYKSDTMALTTDLSNEIMTLKPNKVVVLAREKSGEMKCSLRSGKNGPNLQKALEKALIGIKGYGGGHEHACGANITSDDFQNFLKQLKSAIRKA